MRELAGGGAQNSSLLASVRHAHHLCAHLAPDAAADRLSAADAAPDSNPNAGADATAHVLALLCAYDARADGRLRFARE